MAIVRALVEARSTLASPASWFSDWAAGSKSATGRAVTDETALSATTVFAAVRIISETLASVPLKVYERSGDRKQPATGHSLFPILHDEPNPEQTSMEFREMMQGFVLTHGNAFAQIVRNRNTGQVVELWPITPHRVRASRASSGALRYLVRLPDGADDAVIPAEDMLHLRGFSRNGVLGDDVIRRMREAIGLTLAMEEYGARFFGNGASTTGVVNHPQKMNPEAHKRLKDSFNEKHAGLSNAHRAIILEEGATFTPTAFSPEDAQAIDARKFQVAEVARIFNLPPHLLRDLERATFSNIEQQSLEFVTFTMRPWFVRWEQSMNKRLLSISEKPTYYTHHVIEGLLRGDIKSRFEALAIARQNGVINADDWREIEDMNPLPDGQGQTYLVPLNMIPADKAAEIPVSTDEPPVERQEREARGVVDIREKRAERSITARRRIEAQFLPLWEDAGDNIFRREIKAAERALDKAFKNRNIASFEDWIAEFYATHPQYATERSYRIIHAMAVAIRAEIADEVGAVVGSADQEIDEFVRAYGHRLGEREARASVGQLRAIMRDTPPEEVEAALRERLNEWKEKRSKKFARQNAVRAQNALAREVYKLRGVTQVKWVTIGDNCPLCTSMNGRTVSITGAFLRAGETVDPGVEGTAPLTTRKLIRHPPLHAGCDCTISAA